MKYTVEYTAQAVKELKKLDKQNRALIIGWIEKNLVGCTDPRQHGKGLTANRSGQWRYRVGDYRLLAEIQDKKIVILILNVGHRSEIYKQSQERGSVLPRSCRSDYRQRGHRQRAPASVFPGRPARSGN